MNPIGVFDSGFGGLTILKELKTLLPTYDYLYLGDNERAPYGTKSTAEVTNYTINAIDWFIANGCSLIILACNTASAVALRNIQQLYLHQHYPSHIRVLGVVRPTTETIGLFSKTNAIGLFATQATVLSNSYGIEIAKFFPKVKLSQHACPLWVPIIENNVMHTNESHAIIKKDIETLCGLNKQIDTILLACTHYPILSTIIKQYINPTIQIVTQGTIVANSLKNYLLNHSFLHTTISKNGNLQICTTQADLYGFNKKAALFIPLQLPPAKQVFLNL